MLVTILKSKIHRATVTEANLNYIGSITIDENLMEAANIIESAEIFELVLPFSKSLNKTFLLNNFDKITSIFYYSSTRKTTLSE